jgi:hypothetical protein
MADRIEIEIGGRADGAVAAGREAEKALERVIAQTRNAGGATEELEAQLARLREKNAQDWTAEYTKQLKAVIEEQQLVGKGAEDLQARLTAVSEAQGVAARRRQQEAEAARAAAAAAAENELIANLPGGIKVLSQDDIARALKNTGDAADRAGANLRGMSTAAGASAQIISNLERISRGGIDSILGLVGAVRALGAAFLASSGWVGVVLASLGLAAGAFLALKDKIRPAKEALDESGAAAETAAKRIDLAKKATEDAAEVSSRAAVEGIRALADAYDTVAKRADAALQSIRAISRAQQGVDDAALEKTLAQIDLDEKQGKITAPEAAAARFQAQQGSAARGFARDQAERDRVIDRESATIQRAEQERGGLDDQARRAESDVERARLARSSLDVQRARVEEERRVAEEEAQRRVAEAEAARERERRRGRSLFVRTQDDIDRQAAVDDAVEQARREQEATRARFRQTLGDDAFVAQIGREEKEGRITKEEAERARSSERAIGTLGRAEIDAAAELAAAEARAKQAAEARATETAKLDELIVATRDRIQQLEREKQLAEEAFRLRQQTAETRRAGEIFDEQKVADREQRQAAVDTAGRELGADVRRGLATFRAATPDAAGLIGGVDRAAAALEDGVKGGELGALLTSIDRLADAAEKAGSASAETFRRAQRAIETRVQRLEAQMRHANDGR